MPRVKLSEFEEKDRLVQGLIAKNQTFLKLSDEDVAKKVSLSKRTYQNKKNRPRTFNLHELRRVCKILGFSEDEKSQIL